MASISDRVGDVGSYLREQREHARLSLRQLATLAGVSNPYLSQVERGLRKPSAEVLQQIARGLRISAEVLYVRAGILEEDQRPDVESAVQADATLSDRQKRVLLDIYAAFRTENARVAVESDQPAAPPREASPSDAAAADGDSEGNPSSAQDAADAGATEGRRTRSAATAAARRKRPASTTASDAGFSTGSAPETPGRVSGQGTDQGTDQAGNEIKDETTETT